MNREILRLAVPNIISNISVPLAGMIDLAILGHLESEIYIGAIAVGTLIFNYIYAIFSFLRMGTSGFTAQAFGKNSQEEQISILAKALIFAFGGGIILVLVQFPVSWLSFKLIGGSLQVESLALEYFRIRIYAAPASLGILALSGWYTGMQNARYPMIIALVVNVLAVIANLFFVYGLGMKSAGVAWGGLIAMYAGLVLGLILFLKKYSGLLLFLSKSTLLDLRRMTRFLKVNSDIMIRTICLISTFAFFTSRSANMDNTVLAVNTLLLQFLFLFSYLADGFAYAAEAIVGKYIGSENQNKLKEAIKRLFLWGIYISIPIAGIYFILGSKILLLLTDKIRIVEVADPYLVWIALVPLLSFAAFIWDGIYIGATASAAIRNTMLVSTLLVFLPSFYIFTGYFGNHGLWLSLMLFMISRGILLTVFARKYIYRFA